jgi:hypothetical protein
MREAVKFVEVLVVNVLVFCKWSAKKMLQNRSVRPRPALKTVAAAAREYKVAFRMAAPSKARKEGWDNGLLAGNGYQMTGD